MATRKIGREFLGASWAHACRGVALGEVLVDTPTLLVRALAAPQLLAMKLCAWRDDVDIGDALVARQWVADAARAGIVWTTVAPPTRSDPIAIAVGAGVVELLAARAGHEPPPWTTLVPGAPHPVFLVRAGETMPRLRRACEIDGPEPLRRRRLLAPADFLTAA
ncbi:MAG: hypothetical protein AABZ30_01360 [Myxococcota bacterium]